MWLDVASSASSAARSSVRTGIGSTGTVPSFFATMKRVQMSQLERCGLAFGLGGFWKVQSFAANCGDSAKRASHSCAAAPMAARR